MVIVDTTVWIDYLDEVENAHTLWLDKRLGLQPMGLTDLIYCEVLQGIRNDATFLKVQKELSTFEIYDTGGVEMADAAAKNYRTLRSKGHTVRTTIDCLIASFCLSYGHSLLHHDRDFDSFEKYLGLQVIHP